MEDIKEKISFENIKRYGTDSLESSHGCYVVYEDYVKMVMEAYAMGVNDAKSSKIIVNNIHTGK